MAITDYFCHSLYEHEQEHEHEKREVEGMEIQNPMGLILPESLFGGGLVMPYQEYAPQIGKDVFVAPNAAIVGRVNLGDRASIWFGAVLRGDIAPVEVGEG